MTRTRPGHAIPSVSSKNTSHVLCEPFSCVPGSPITQQLSLSQVFGNNVGFAQLSISASALTHKSDSSRAHPVTVPHPNCGHTFCAICMVKHFFSRFHRTCGGWHEHVECPMCRSILIYTPNSLPRSPLTFPFAKNRMADAAVEAMLNQLTNRIDDILDLRNYCETLERSKRGSKIDCETPLLVWKSGGSSRMEWLERREYVF